MEKEMDQVCDEIQKKINFMMEGNQKVIEESIYSENQALVVNAIIFGVKHGIKSPEFCEGLKKVTEREEKLILVGCPVSYLAVSACHLLGIQEYTGDDSIIKEWIECKMRFF